jgi:SAM-dependent methyltransferase
VGDPTDGEPNRRSDALLSELRTDVMDVDGNYEEKLKAEARKWSEHLKVEAEIDVLGDSWLDHPLIAEQYRQRALVDGEEWQRWIVRRLGGPAGRSFELGCGTAGKSIGLFSAGATRHVEGIDISDGRLAEVEGTLRENRIPGSFMVGDANKVRLSPCSYDLVFSCHSFHHFLQLEQIMEQVHESLTPNGLFVLEEYIGPTQFQWTDLQIELVKSLLLIIPEKLRVYRWGTVKNLEGRPTPAEVVAASPFESIRSSEILPLFKRYFQIVRYRPTGGTLQHLLYNGIVHNFIRDRTDGDPYATAIFQLESALIDQHLIPSDFAVLVGQRRDAPLKDEAPFADTEESVERLRNELNEKQREIDRMKGTLGWRLLSRYGRIKYRYLLPFLQTVGLGSKKGRDDR